MHIAMISEHASPLAAQGGVDSGGQKVYERSWRYDIVHANFFTSGQMGLFPRDRPHLPLVVTFHALGRVRRLHQDGADGERIAIVPCGVDTPELGPGGGRARERLGVLKRDHRIDERLLVVGGIRHTVVDGETGYRVPPHDPSARTERLKWLHDDPLRARSFGSAGLRRIRSSFTWKRVATSLNGIYEELRARTAPAFEERAGS